MGLIERLWNAVRFLVRIDDKVERLTDSVRSQQVKLEALNDKVLRLEALLLLSSMRQQMAHTQAIELKDGPGT